jgi:uncharacterized membrane protein
MNQSAASPSGRLEFLDLIRGIFILIMVEGHTLRALLSMAAQASAIYVIQDLIHNLTGPAFLFASGAALVYSTQGHWESFRQWSPKLRRRLFRWLGVLVAGYALQLTYGTLSRSLIETTPRQLAYLFSLNILQCIVLGLFVLQLLIHITPNERWFFRATVLGGVGIALATPFVWDDAAGWPVWLASLVSGRTQSIFPLFPYTGFTLAGAAWGYLHSAARGQGRPEGSEAEFLRSSMRACMGLCLASGAIALLPLPESYSDFWSTSPQFFLLRAGVLGLVTTGARHLEPRLLPRLRVLAMAGRESLLIYVLHLVALYGSAFNPDTSLVKTLGTPQPAGYAILVWVLFTAALLIIAGMWSWWKKGRDWQVTGLRWTVAGYLAYIFLAG